MKKKYYYLLFLYIPLIAYGQLPAYNWGGQIGGNDYDEIRQLTTDYKGNVIVTGVFNGTADFDILNSNSFTITGVQTNDAFIAKYDSNGALLWVNIIEGDTGTNINPFITDINTDRSGNIILTGYYEGTFDFDPSANRIFNLTSSGDTDIFLLKLDTHGEFVNAISIGSVENDRSLVLEIDDNDHIYISGYIGGSVDFDPGAGTTTLSGFSAGTTFISKMDIDFNLLWAQDFDGSGDEGRAIAIDNQSNIYLTGHVNGSIDADPGNGTTILNATGNIRAIFLIILDASGNYVASGITESANSGSVPGVEGIALDSSDNIILCGRFSGQVDFDLGSGTQNIGSSGSTAFSDVFVLKLSNSLAFQWVARMGSAVNDGARDVTIDDNDNIFTTGFYVGGGFPGADFDPGPAIVSLQGGTLRDTFISILAPDGSYLDAIDIRSNNNNEARRIHKDTAGNLLIAGSFINDIIDFPSYDVNSAGGSDGYLFKYGNTTNPTLSELPPVAMDDSATIIQPSGQIIDIVQNDSDVNNNIDLSSIVIITEPSNGSVTVNNNGTLTYIPNPGTTSDIIRYTITDNTNLTSNVAQIDITTVLSNVDFQLKSDVLIYPNPATGLVNIKTDYNIKSIALYDLKGLKVLEQVNADYIDISMLSNSCYILKVNTKYNGVISKLIVKQ